MFSNICSCDLLISVNTFTLCSEQCFAAAHMQTPRTSILGFWTVFFPECLSRRCWTVDLRLQCSLLGCSLPWDQVCALLATMIPAAMGSALRPGVSNLTRLNKHPFFPFPSLAAGFLSAPKEWWQSLIWTRPQSDASDWGLGFVSNQSRVGGWKLTVL